MNISIIDQGVDLMLYGMGTVFLFLSLLVFATWLMSRLIQVLGLDNDESEVTHIETKSHVDEKTLKILQAAINKHLNKD